jgi:hypothetical protein
MSVRPSSDSPRPRLWVRMSVAKGNLIQLADLVLGASLLYLAGTSRPPGP